MTTYTIQTSKVASGTVTVKLYTVTAGLTVPTSQTLIVDAETVEKMDVIPGTSMIQDMQFSFIEDYSTYPEGFWFKALTADSAAEMSIFLDEGSGDTPIFWGVFNDQAIQMDEIDLTPGSLTRSGKLTAMSAFAKLKNVDIPALGSFVFTYALWTTMTVRDYPVVGTGTGVRFMSLIASMISTAFSQSFAESDVTLVGDDFEYQVSAMATSVDYVSYPGFTFSDLIFMYDIGGSQVGYLGLLTTLQTAWRVRFANCFDLLAMICKNFCLVPRYWYDTSTGRHKITLYPRGQMTDPVVTMTGSIIRSSFTKRNATQTFVVEAVRQTALTNMTYPETWPGSIVLNDDYGSASNCRGTVSSGPAPSPNTPDINISMDFQAYFLFTSPTDFSVAEHVFVDYNDPTYGRGYYRAAVFKWRDYVTSTWRPLGGESEPPRFTHSYMIVQMLYNRFSAQKRSYERTYRGMKANNGTTTSQNNVQIGCRTVINDGVSDRTFYATEVRKNPFTDTVSVVWNEV